uniref:Uncharacterized protein n=1 Tax=Arundo donax TaxID=35708 RepID=A0A0A8Z4J7_ARUDO
MTQRKPNLHPYWLALATIFIAQNK